MANKLNYDANSILNVKFSPSQKGYNALEVDQIFDKIIQDYETTAAELNKLANENANQLEKFNKLKKDYAELKFEMVCLQKKFDTLKQASNVNEDNYKLVMKVAAYERALYKKGINPKKALSDPDNC